MEWLSENPIAIVTTGVVFFVAAGVVHSQTRGRRSLWAMLVIVAATAAALAVERWLQTPRERVATAVYQLAENLEGNDLAATLAAIAPDAAVVRDEVERILPRVRLVKARVTSTPEIVIADATPDQASVSFRALVDGTDSLSGGNFAFFDRVTLHFVLTDDQWLLNDYDGPRRVGWPRR